jgi:type III secretory pathway lipoprotein EscJ
VNFLKNKTGQLNPALVWTIIIMLVAVAIGGLVYSRISSELEKQVSDDNAETMTFGENVLASVNQGANTVFPLLVLMVVIAVLVSVVLIVKVLA